MESPRLGTESAASKVEKLRSLGIGFDVPLPQLVVVGERSSGKSAVLERLTGIPFPRGANLCTRHATRVSYDRKLGKSIEISITPRPGAEKELNDRLLSFRRSFVDLPIDELTEVFAEAMEVMGIGLDDPHDSIYLSGSMRSDMSTVTVFSEDVLNIVISGPEEVQLTVIDVPGVFRVPAPGLTTDADITLVENMVKSYMNNRRTIILAVIPCNDESAAQNTLDFAEAADPGGVRTMAVLTKPDLSLELTMNHATINTLLGKRNNLGLGYVVVQNRGILRSSPDIFYQNIAETAFFTGPRWSSIQDRCGLTALNTRLGKLLGGIARERFHEAEAEIAERLANVRKQADTMGTPRHDQNSQRLYLGKLASRFQAIAQDALRGHYAVETVFADHPEMRLISRILKLCEQFSVNFSAYGHLDSFNDPNGDEHGQDEDDKGEGKNLAGDKNGGDDEGEGDNMNGEKDDEDLEAEQQHQEMDPGPSPGIPEYPELSDILDHEDYVCPAPLMVA